MSGASSWVAPRVSHLVSPFAGQAFRRLKFLNGKGHGLAVGPGKDIPKPC